MSNEHSSEEVRLTEALLDAMPNRCCDDWRTCPYDRHDADQIITALRPHLLLIWENGYDRAMQDAYSALNRFGYIERLRDSGDEPNPWRIRPAAPSGGSES